MQLTSQLLASFAKVVDSQMTTRRVARELQTQITPAQVKAKVNATPVLQTLLIDVTASDPDPAFAAQLANAAAKALASVIDELGASSSGGIKASIIDQASVPRKPVSPNPRRDIAVGGFLGLALGAAAALAIDALDRTIRQAEVAAEAFGAPVLCSIPRQRRISSDPLVALKSGGSLHRRGVPGFANRHPFPRVVAASEDGVSSRQPLRAKASRPSPPTSPSPCRSTVRR